MKSKSIIFWLAVIISTLMLWWRGEAWVLDGEGQGYRWPDYIYNAWMIDLQESRLYDPFRNPLHGFCVAKLGSLMGGYINAAIAISSLSIWLVMFSCAQAVRIWIGNWAGATVALLVSFSLPLADASQWSNLYPMLAGGIALCFWAVSRLWIYNRGLIFAGFVGGLAWAIDPRALPFVLLVSISVLWCGVRTLRFGRLCIGLFFVFYGYSLQDGFGMAESHHLDTSEYVRAQKEVVIGRMNSHNNPMLTQKCSDIPSSLIFSLDLLKTPCGKEMIYENVDVGIPRQLTLPLWFVGFFSFSFLLIPGRDWLGRVLISGCIVGTASISFLTMAIEERYMLLNTGPLIALSVLGCFWCFSRLMPIRFVEMGLGVGLIFVGGALDKKRQELGSAPGTRDSSNNKMWNKSALFVQRNLPSEALFLDCSAQSVNLSLLPKKTIEGTPPALFAHMMTEGVARYCVRWLRSPPDGEVFFGIGPQHWQDGSGTSQMHYDAVLQALQKSTSWKRAGKTPYYSLYRYIP